MDPLILKDEEETRQPFRPLSFAFLRSARWDGAWTDAAWLWPWMRPHLKGLLVAMVFFATSAGASIGIPRMVAYLVDRMLTSPPQENTLIWLLAGLMVIKVAADLSYKWLVTKLGQRMTKELRQDVFRRLGDFPLAFFDKNSAGRLISRCVSDVSNLSAFFTANFFTALSDLVVMLGCWAVLSSLNPWAGLWIACMLIPLTIYMLNVSQDQMGYAREMRHMLSRMTGHTSDSMNNLSVLHSQPFSDKWIARFSRLQSIYVRQAKHNMTVWGFFSSGNVVAMGLSYLGTVVLGVLALRAGTLTIGGFIACCTYVTLIFDPFSEIAEKLNTILTALSSSKRLRELGPSPHHLPPKLAGDVKPIPTGSVRFENLVFSYHADSPLFQGLNLELPEGKVTALVGRTGSGKTTLAHLLLGLYPISSGRIMWGNENLQDFTPERHTRWITHVSQDLFLFSDSLRENLRLWRTEISDDLIWERLTRMGLADKVKALPEGLDTEVKAETLPFSQGERQLLLLCRALLRDPRLLVFDEATASLDHETENLWLDHVGELFAGRTTLFIAHRLETLRFAHQVVVLEGGHVRKVFSKAPGVPVSENDLR